MSIQSCSFPAKRRSRFVNHFSAGATVLAFMAPIGSLWAAAPPAANESGATRPPEVGEVTVSAADADGQGAYGQPAWVKRSRTSSLTNAYVLSPFSASAGLIWEGIKPRHGEATNLYNQEFELGLPYRMQLAVENQIEQFDGTVQNKSTSVEFRYALADWNQIPLNPTVFAEWKFGQGHELHEEGEAESEADGGEEADRENEEKPRTPDSYELRLLLSQGFCKNWQWTLNGFFEQEVGLDRERELGFSQCLIYALPGSSFEVGVEMQFDSKTKSDSRSEHDNSFVIGPCLGYEFTPCARLDVAPLFGIGGDSPQVDAFIMFSYQFGGSVEKEGRQPISTSNR